MDSNSLVQMTRGGDREALCELIERYRSLGRRTAFSILKNREDAEDALQEASFRAFLKFSTFEGSAAFSTWFTRIVINTCLMQIRKHRTHPTYSLDEMLAEETCSSYQLISKNPTPEQECGGTELLTLVRTTVRALPMHLRHVAEDRFYEELSLNALAEKRGISATAAKSRLFRARRMLSEVLNQANTVNQEEVERIFLVKTFESKVVIITGGSAGIGRAAALQFAALGARVLITGRRAERLDKVSIAHPNIEALVADTSKEEDAILTVRKAVQLWGRIDTLLNNAGSGAIMPLAQADAERVKEIFAVNVVGPTLLAKEALPYLTKTTGSIVNISSTYGTKAGAMLSHYGASKAALEYMTRSWALELAPMGVRVNAIAVGPTETEALTGMMGLSKQEAEAVKHHEIQQIPLKRRGMPDEVARWIVLLANPENNWVTGQIIGVDGGLAIA